MIETLCIRVVLLNKMRRNCHSLLETTATKKGLQSCEICQGLLGILVLYVAALGVMVRCAAGIAALVARKQMIGLT